jgi:DNA helicase IV
VSTPETDELTFEQGFLDEAFRCLAEMTARTSDAADDAAERSAGDWDATVAYRHLSRRLATMDPDAGPLCFGRIDEDDGTPWHIGRRHVENARGEPVVVDWRTPVAVPFYRATFRDPLGLHRRRRFILEARRVVDLLDEDFNDPDSAAGSSASGLPDPLLAELGRSRTGAMHDIVATIAGEQDSIIRAPVDTPVIVQGGPGTGKTAVGLHRAAFLLYEHRVRLEREGVLVLGPNPLFLAYVSDVLPSLGEVAVTQTTLAGLLPAYRVRGSEEAAAASLKGDIRMASVIADVARGVVRPLTEDLSGSTRWGSSRLSADEVNQLLSEALASGGAVGQQRNRFRRAIGRSFAARLSARSADLLLDADEVLTDLARDRGFQTDLQRIWPAQSAPALVRLLFGRSTRLAAAAAGRLSPPELAQLRRPASRSLATEPWTDADLPLIDEADSVLTGAPRRYGHIVVDEAQDLSAMALRMVARRSLNGRSLTVLGDLAQATAPGALGRWETAAEALGVAESAVVEELTTGYRVPAQIMETANRLLAVAAPDLPPTVSVRRTDDLPVFHQVAAPDVAAQAAAAAAALLRIDPSTCLIASPERLAELARLLGELGVPFGLSDHPTRPGFVSLLRPSEAKGLEFDAVVIAEPAEILSAPGGPGLLYIALTRAVQQLTVVFSGELPEGLRA